MTVQLSARVFFLVLMWLAVVGSEQSQAQVTGGQQAFKLDAFAVSDGSYFEPKDHYPKFSWDTTPTYFMFGDTHRLLSPEEVNFIAARTDFLCIEKSHGRKPLGAAELGANEVAAFRKIKPRDRHYATLQPVVDVMPRAPGKGNRVS